MSDVDDLVDAALGEEPADEQPTDNDDESPRPELFVCDWVLDDGELCGASFANSHGLNGHKTAKHRRDPAKAGRPRKTAPKSRSRTKSRPATPKPDAVAEHYRAEMYATSIIATAVFAHLVGARYFDAYDMNVVTGKASEVAGALEAVGEQNKAFQQACDALLGAAGGAVYLQLFVAVSGMVIPILAHHGVLPAGTGDRFLGLADVAVPTPPTSTVGGNGESVAPATGGETGAGVTLPADVSTWTIEEWQSVMFNATRSPAFAEMMQNMNVADMVPPTVVDVPAFSETRVDNGATGTDPDHEPTATETLST